MAGSVEKRRIQSLLILVAWDVDLGAAGAVGAVGAVGRDAGSRRQRYMFKRRRALGLIRADWSLRLGAFLAVGGDLTVASGTSTSSSTSFSR